MNERARIFKISGLCLSTYLVSYLVRNLLSVYTPHMLAAADITEAGAALFSSAYMLAYAVGQLLFGTAGDYVKPKYLVSGGLALAGLALTAVPLAGGTLWRTVFFAALGLGLSALRGPLVKVISENMEKNAARVSCLLLSTVSYAGTLCVGLFGVFLRWRTGFFAGAGLCFAFALAAFLLLTVFERRGTIALSCAPGERVSLRELFSVFTLPGFLPFLLISATVEIGGTAIEFWIPTYFNQNLGIGEELSGLLFSVIALLKALCPILCIPLLKPFRDRDDRLMRLCFLLAAVCFGLLLVVPGKWAGVALIFLSVLAFTFCSSVVWGIFIPSLGRYHKVSGANGLLDCTGYAVAAAANLCFSLIMEAFGWTGTVVLWSLIALAGAGWTLIETRRRALPDGT